MDQGLSWGSWAWHRRDRPVPHGRWRGFADEGQVPEAEHVEAGEQRSDQADEVEHFAESAVLEGFVENGVFGEESGEGPDAGDGDDARGHGPESDGQFLAQAAHLAHVLLAAEAVDDGARGEEEQGLEEGVGHQVEDGGRVGRYAAAEEHVSELRDGGVGEDALDVGLDEGDGGGEEGCGRADDGDDREREGRAVEDAVGPGDHVDAGGDHGGGVDERGDRRGAFHGVGEPDVERNLRGFAAGADEQAESDGGEHSALQGGIRGETRRRSC